MPELASLSNRFSYFENFDDKQEVRKKKSDAAPGEEGGEREMVRNSLILSVASMHFEPRPFLKKNNLYVPEGIQNQSKFHTAFLETPLKREKIITIKSVMKIKG